MNEGPVRYSVFLCIFFYIPLSVFSVSDLVLPSLKAQKLEIRMRAISFLTVIYSILCMNAFVFSQSTELIATRACTDVQAQDQVTLYLPGGFEQSPSLVTSLVANPVETGPGRHTTYLITATGAAPLFEGTSASIHPKY